MREVTKRIRKGKQDYLETDVEQFKALSEECRGINEKIHQVVLDNEGGRYGVAKSQLDDFDSVLDSYSGQIESKDKAPDFEKMSKEELLAYIKGLNLNADKGKEEVKLSIDKDKRRRTSNKILILITFRTGNATLACPLICLDILLEAFQVFLASFKRIFLRIRLRHRDVI